MSTGEPALDPEKSERVEQARNFAFHLLKGIKQLGMYRHNDARFAEFLGKAHEALAAYTDQHGALSLKVEAQNLALYDQPLFNEDTPLPYRFYRDGIRQLIFRPGIPVEELVTFTLIALSDPERGGEDALAQLWRAALEHVEYVVVEGFKLEDSSEEEVEVAVEQIVSYLYNRLRTDSDDFLRFARVSTEDLDRQVEEVDQIRGAVISGDTASDELKARLQKEIEEEENHRLFPKLVSAVFQMVESGIDNGSALEEICIHLLDALLLKEDFATINSIVTRLRAMEEREGGEGVASALKNLFVMKMGEEQRLGMIGELLRVGRPKNAQDISRYLQSVEAVATSTLLAVLEPIEIPENRSMLCDVLAARAKENPDPFIQALQSERPQTVRDMLHILEKSGHPDRVKCFAQVLQHKNLAVKLEALNVIALTQSGEARRLLLESLADPQPQVRICAARLLPEFDREKAFADLSRVIRDSSFEKRSADEKTAFYAALGSTGLPVALSMLSQILAARPTLLNKKKILEDKLLAVAGLAAASSIQALKLLQVLVEDKRQPPEVLVATRRAIYQTRKALFGEMAEAQ
ncbi:MAG TPA: HEAT repeat domain-containing protein [Myxococcaceae bacterium]|nr:HEAT repeat domain-containing protein [Myxococcaceae bacterium]